MSNGAPESIRAGRYARAVPKNVEIKAKLSDPQATRMAVAALADDGPEILHQRDTFFATNKGRLKLRLQEDGDGQFAELIAYERPDEAGTTVSHYDILPVDDPERLLEMLERVLGVAGRVEKRRELSMIGRTRVHIDEIAGLGVFLELEVVLAAGEPESAGHKEAAELFDSLDIPAENRVVGAYVDLIAG